MFSLYFLAKKSFPTPIVKDALLKIILRPLKICFFYFFLLVLFLTHRSVLELCLRLAAFPWLPLSIFYVSLICMWS